MQIIRECDKCGREQYDSNVGGICDRCGGTWRLATYVKLCPNCGATFSQHHQFKVCPNNCKPSFLVRVPQASYPAPDPTPEDLRLCPFCGGNDYHEYIRADRGSKVYRSCRGCGAEAPLTAWDKLRVNIVCLDDVGDSPVSETSRIRGCHWPADGRPEKHTFHNIDGDYFVWHVDHTSGHKAPSADHYPEYDIAQGCWMWRKDNIIRYNKLNNSVNSISIGNLYTFIQWPSSDVTQFRRHSLKPDWHPFPYRSRVWMDNTGQLWEAPTDKAEPHYIADHPWGWPGHWFWVE